jgi:hypothetical protein
VATLITSGAVKLKAGENAPTLTGDEYDQLIEEGEAFVSVQSRYDWVTNWPTVSGMVGAGLVQDAVACHSAISVIQNDRTGFFSRMDAQTGLDVLYSKLVDNINLLRDEKFRTFVIKGEVE